MSNKYEHIEAPYAFKEYWSKYPQGYSIFEALLDWVSQVNDLMDNTASLEENINILQGTMDAFLTTIPSELQAISEAQLNEWLIDGTFEGIINDTLFSELESSIDSVSDSVDLVHPEVRSELGYITPQMFGALGDGVNNDSPAIALALAALTAKNGGTLFFPEGTYKITETISIGDNFWLKGSKRLLSTILTSDNTFSAISVASNARYVTIEELTITSFGGIGASNCAILGDFTNGGANQLYRNLLINGFAYGMRFKEIWWMNRVEEVRANDCMVSFEFASTGGQAINNTFHSVYSNKPTTLGLYISGMKNSTFIACNFGGHETLPGRFVFLSLVKAVKFLGCNFEHLIVEAGSSAIRIFSDSTVLFETCTLVNNSATATSYEIEIRDTSEVTLVNVQELSAGANIKQIALYNSSRLINQSTLITDINHISGSGSLSRSNNLLVPRQYTTNPIVLSGGAQTIVLFNPSRPGRIISAKAIYSAATSADSGISVVVRDSVNAIVNFSFTSETSKAQWTVTDIPIAQSIIRNYPIVLVTSGNKVGAGSIVFALEVVYD